MTTSAVDQEEQTVFVRESNDEPHVVAKDDEPEYVVPASGHVLLSDSCETVEPYGWADGSIHPMGAGGRSGGIALLGPG